MPNSCPFGLKPATDSETKPVDPAPEPEKQPAADIRVPKLVVTDPLAPPSTGAVASEPSVKHYEVVQTEMPPPAARKESASKAAKTSRLNIAKTGAPLFDPVVITIPSAGESKVAEAELPSDAARG